MKLSTMRYKLKLGRLAPRGGAFEPHTEVVMGRYAWVVWPVVAAVLTALLEQYPPVEGMMLIGSVRIASPIYPSWWYCHDTGEYRLRQIITFLGYNDE